MPNTNSVRTYKFTIQTFILFISFPCKYVPFTESIYYLSMHYHFHRLRHSSHINSFFDFDENNCV